MTRTISVLAALALAACGTSFQSAALLAPGATQVTGGIGRTTPDDDFDPADGALWAGDVQVRHGITPTIEAGGRYANVGGAHFIGADVKFAIVPKHLSVGVPFGVTFAEDAGADGRELNYGGLVLAPTLFVGTELSPNTVEIVGAPKIYLVFPDGAGSDSELGVSLGLRLSTDLGKWAVMPEIAYVDVSGEGQLLTFGLGLSANLQ